MIDLLNRNSKNFRLSPFYLCLVAFCFSMTIGVIWEFFEYAADALLNIDMQKDNILQNINSVTLDPAQAQNVSHINDIVRTEITTASGDVFVIDGGYLDTGLADTMGDLFVNFLGALTFCIFGYIGMRHAGRHKKASLVFDLVPSREQDTALDDNYAFAEDDGFTDGIDENGQPK